MQEMIGDYSDEFDACAMGRIHADPNKNGQDFAKTESKILQSDVIRLNEAPDQDHQQALDPLHKHF